MGQLDPELVSLAARPGSPAVWPALSCCGRPRSFGKTTPPLSAARAPPPVSVPPSSISLHLWSSCLCPDGCRHWADSGGQGRQGPSLPASERADKRQGADQVLQRIRQCDCVRGPRGCRGEEPQSCGKAQSKSHQQPLPGVPPHCPHPEATHGLTTPPLAGPGWDSFTRTSLCWSSSQ